MRVWEIFFFCCTSFPVFQPNELYLELLQQRPGTSETAENLVQTNPARSPRFRGMVFLPLFLTRAHRVWHPIELFRFPRCHSAICNGTRAAPVLQHQNKLAMFARERCQVLVGQVNRFPCRFRDLCYAKSNERCFSSAVCLRVWMCVLFGSRGRRHSVDASVAHQTLNERVRCVCTVK